MPDSFLTEMEMRLAEQIAMAKRDRTRERLRIAALQVLNERGYEDMRTLTKTGTPPLLMQFSAVSQR